MKDGFLYSNIKEQCFGCEGCAQVCPTSAISMKEDEEEFRYPVVDMNKCIGCNLCHKVCPFECQPERLKDNKYAFGGYINDESIREQSTSGGAFSAIVESWCDENYVIFGAETQGLEVYHTFITDKSEIGRFRKSKYIQSVIGDSYTQCKIFLKEGKKVLFSGTPCHIAGLKAFLGNMEQTNLLTVEVVCEGVPSPLYIKKYSDWCEKKYGVSIEYIDYRYKDKRKWDFQVMLASLRGGKQVKIDRWVNPFWSVWLKHLMSRPSCYKCPYANKNRVADISLGDLWGVHIYCPELYGKNSGASLVVCNSEKGKSVVNKAETLMYGHELDFDIALKYQGPMRKSIDVNIDRDTCMRDLADSTMSYVDINKKWATNPNLKLLWQKYVWGNRQKVFIWNLRNRWYK